MTDRLIRLMRIITLVQAKPGILARELAERCGNSERTIYRDMEALSSMHIPIAHMGHGKGYNFIGNFALYPLDWSEEEAAAFSQLRHIMDQVKPLLPASFESAYEKVMAAEYKQKTEREEKMESTKTEAGSVWLDRGGSPLEQPVFLTEILSAVLKQQTILVDYSENTMEEHGIEIDPYCVVPLENRFHLIGFCHRYGLIRTFHISGFATVKRLGRGFSKEKFDLQSFMKQKWSLDQDSLQVEFRVKFSERVLEHLKEEQMRIKPVKLDREARCLYFKVAVEQDIGFVRWVMGFEEEAEIIEPVYYRDVMRHELEKWLTLYK